MNVKEILSQLTLKEKATLLIGAGGMESAGVERLGISRKQMADGPHGVRKDIEKNCTQFPNLCSLAATWDVDAAEKMGKALSDECNHHGVDMLLGPGMNIKRNPLCGRNFEYFSEDPVQAGEMAAGYINGLQSGGTAASLKHFAMNNQETYRTEISAEADERTMREIYFKGFEIAVKKAKPVSVMCSYNKIGGIWTSENPYLLTEVLREDWEYDGFVVSDWGAVHDIVKCVKAGLDLQMPADQTSIQKLLTAVEQGELTETEIDRAASRILRFLLMPKTEKRVYDRAVQHQKARELAAEGVVLLKNDEHVLPLKQYKKIAVVGEFADKPLITGQGSAEVFVKPEYIDSPLEELRKALPDADIKFMEIYKSDAYSRNMLWPQLPVLEKFVEDCEAVILFAGSMVSEDTEFLDRRSAYMNENYELFIRYMEEIGKKVIVVLQSGSALILGNWRKDVSAIVQMWLAGEGAGGAIADVLSGKVNPSGKLPETFPTKLRGDMNGITRSLIDTYPERLEVGYRYYDRHPEEIAFAFGHGLSYTDFEYSNLQLSVQEKCVKVSLMLKNVGNCKGKEVVQLYISVCDSYVSRPEKELKAFFKVQLLPGESRELHFELSKDDFAYYNPMLHAWVAEGGRHQVLIGASSRDIRLSKIFLAKWKAPYTVQKLQEDRIG